jgi:hypothetical protein
LANQPAFGEGIFPMPLVFASYISLFAASEEDMQETGAATLLT